MSYLAVIVDCETGEQIERELTQQETKQLETDRKDIAAQEAAQQKALDKKQTARESAIAKLAELGLSTVEAQEVVDG